MEMLKEAKTKVLHLLTMGNIGGIEVLCRDIAAGSELDHTFCFMFGEGTIYDEMLAEGQAVISFKEYKKISRKRVTKLRAATQDFDVIIIHHDDPFLEMYYLLLKRILPEKKYISMVHHCYDPETDKQNYGFIKLNIKRFIVQKMFQKSNKLIFVSNAGYKSYVSDYRIDESKVEIIYNGIGNDKLLAGSNVQKLPHHPLNILYLGRLVKLKGVSSLIDAFSRVASEYDVILNIVGDGGERAKLEEQAKRLGIIDKVTFYGLQRDVISYLKQADIFVYPSRTEIFGISIVEAMAFGCICIANNVGGIPEIISDGINGFLNNSNSEEELQRKMESAISLCGEDMRRQEMMKKARMTAELYSIDNTIKNLEVVCRALAGEVS